MNIDQNLRIHPIAGTSDWRSFSFSGQFHHLVLSANVPIIATSATSPHHSHTRSPSVVKQRRNGIGSQMYRKWH